jgi:hypothetical protein
MLFEDSGEDISNEIDTLIQLAIHNTQNMERTF